MKPNSKNVRRTSNASNKKKGKQNKSKSLKYQIPAALSDWLQIPPDFINREEEAQR